MGFASTILLLSLGLCLGMILAFEIGRRLGRRRIAKDSSDRIPGTSVIEGSLFALLGLLVAFTFSGAADRFDSRRRLIIDETNAIGTAYLRLDLLLPEEQPALRDGFRRYVDARVDVYRKLPDLAAARAELVRVKAIQAEIWERVVITRAPAPAAMLLLPALNTMFDIATSRTLAAELHPPLTIFVMLGALVIAGALFAGYGMAASERSWIHILGYAVTLAISVYVILDLEYPRLGLIRVDAFDRALVELRQAMR